MSGEMEGVFIATIHLSNIFPKVHCNYILVLVSAIF